MSDVDTTKREIDEHEQKGEPHHTRYSDSEARTAVDGANVSIAGDADTVDGKHASDLGGSLSVTSPTNVTGSRSVGTQYTNSTGNALIASVHLFNNAGSAEIYIEVDGTQVAEQIGYDSGGGYGKTTGTAVVPDGSTYTVSAYTGSLQVWTEQELKIA